MAVASPPSSAVRVGPQHVVVRQKVFVAQGLGGLRVVSDADGVSAYFGLGKDDSYLY